MEGYLNVPGFDDLAEINLDEQVALIEMFQYELAAAQRLGELNSLSVHEIVALSNEIRVLLHLQHKYDVARHSSWCLVRLASKGDFLVVLHALIDRNFQDLALLACLFPRARSTLVLAVETSFFSLEQKSRLSAIGHPKAHQDPSN